MSTDDGRTPESLVYYWLKSHVVKLFITWSISPDENNNIGHVYTTHIEEHILTQRAAKRTF